MTNKTRKRLFLCEVLLFSILFLSSSYTVVYDCISSSLTIALWLIVLFLILLFGKPSFKHLPVFLVLMVAFWASFLVNREELVVHLKICFGLCVGYLFFESFPFSLFKKAYINVMIFISVYSVLFLLAFRTIPFLSSFSLLNVPNQGFASIVFFTYTGSLRNCGLFWEPGAFQAFLGVAVIFELVNKNYRSLKTLLLIATMVTTFSTTAFFAVGLFLIFLSFDGKKRTRIKTISRVLIVISMIAVLVFSDYLFNGAYSVFGKLSQFASNKETSTFTTNIRYWATIKPLEGFLTSPIFGLGNYGLTDYAIDYTFGMNTNTVINFFAVYGIVYGILAMTGIFKAVVYEKTLRSIICFFLFLLLIISENFVNNPLFLIIILYGLSISKKDIRSRRVSLSKEMIVVNK